MRDLWDSLSPAVQDGGILAMLLLPVILLAAILWRGYAPAPLIRAIWRRFRWTNVAFMALIAVSVGLGVGLIAQERGLRKGTAAAADKFDLIVSAPGSEMTMLLATVFLQPSDVPLLDGAQFAEIAAHPEVDFAAPLAFGDSYGEAPVIGTTAQFVRYLTDDILEGRMWESDGEAIAGASSGLQIGDEFEPAHGAPHAEEAGEEGHHHDAEIHVVGRMAPTGTPWDRAILVPVEMVWEVHGLANGHAPSAGEQLGGPFDPAYFPGTPAVIVHTEALWANYALKSQFTRDSEMMAFFPGTVLSGLYRVMGDVRQVMSMMTMVTQILVASSVLLGLFILMLLFRRQVAMLRTLGAPRRFIIAVIWSYAAGLLAIGTALGVLLGIATTHLLSREVSHRTDIVIDVTLGWQELHLAAAFLLCTALLALIPAIAILRQPIVEGLRA